jgi:hypothetical protein
MPEINMDSISIPDNKIEEIKSNWFKPKEVTIDENWVETLTTAWKKIDDTVSNSQIIIKDIEDSMKWVDKNSVEYKWYQWDLEKEKEHLSNLKEKEKKAHEDACEKSGWCLEQPTFRIWVNNLIGVWFQKEAWDDTSNTINRTLWTIIQKLMVALWVLSVLIMTVWAGYIIMYHGQDELLSKGKSIFMSGITALIVALSSYYIVSILRFILYN